MSIPKIVGIVNITTDSFSDGGKFIDPHKAIEHAQELLRGGADIIELSGASSNVQAGAVSAEEEIARIEPVLTALSCPISIDTAKPSVQRWALSKKIAYVNDIKGFPDSSLYPELAGSSAQIVVMHAMSNTDRAIRAANTTEQVFDSIYAFFGERIPALEKAGIARKRLIIDPGMGLFLSSLPEPSFAVLQQLPELKKHFGLPVMVSVSRKSFLRAPGMAEEDVSARTVAEELYAAKQGADYIRTHDTSALARALAERKSA